MKPGPLLYDKYSRIELQSQLIERYTGGNIVVGKKYFLDNW